MESLKNAYHDASLPTASVIGSLFLTLVRFSIISMLDKGVLIHFRSSVTYFFP
jgi:hypothetical protein